MSFDLEEAREILYGMQIVRNWYDPRAMQEAWIALREAIAEIERLRAEDVENRKALSGCCAEICRLRAALKKLGKRSAAMKRALISERMQVLAFSPNEIMWRERNGMPSDFRSDEDWAPYEKAAREQLREEVFL